MRKISDIKAELATALAEARAVSNDLPVSKQKPYTDKVVALQKELSDVITAGANPCPDCGELPHGLEQPSGKGGIEYEVGCVAGCPDLELPDGTRIQHRVRGGLLPKHAVDAWNEGPEFWTKVKPPEAAS